MFQYTIHPESDVPIYRQLADQINAKIRSGVLKTGTQLPTVREMAAQLNLSCGTVKRVYDRLQEMGDIEMTRRRGTFVKYVRADSDSRKLQAMTAIDHMIRTLSELQFSPAEIHIFVSLKMREWGLKWSGLRISLVTEHADFSAAFEDQLNQLGNVHVMLWKPKQVREYPYNVDEQSDVILASGADAQRLEGILPNRSKLICIAFQPEPRQLFELAQAAVEGAGVICQDKALVHLIRSLLADEMHARLRYAYANDPDACTALVRECGRIVITDETLDMLGDRIAGLEEKCLRFAYGIDTGSMIYLAERINRIRDERQLQPGALHMGDMPSRL